MLAQANCRELPLAANSVDLIFTDPPYLREYLPCYGWLAREAKRVLKPGGYLFAYGGAEFTPQVIAMLGEHLNYFWVDVLLHTGGFPRMWHKELMSGYKPCFVYTKGKPSRKKWRSTVTTNSRTDKQYHDWEQGMRHPMTIIDCLTNKGDLICDPFIGGGTTAAACALIGRRCVGFDLEPASLAASQDRLTSENGLLKLPLFQTEARQ